MAGDLQVLWKCKKSPGIEGILLIYFFSARNPFFGRIFPHIPVSECTLAGCCARGNEFSSDYFRACFS